MKSNLLYYLKKKRKKNEKYPPSPPSIKPPNNSYSHKAANKVSNTITVLRTIFQILQFQHKICSTTIHCTLLRNSCKKSLKIPKRISESYIEEEQTTQWPKDIGHTRRRQMTNNDLQTYT